MDPNFVIIIFDISIKNNIVTFISHIYLHSNGIKKIIHYAVNITLTEGELFVVRCGINQAIQILDVFYLWLLLMSFIQLNVFLIQ